MFQRVAINSLYSDLNIANGCEIKYNPRKVSILIFVNVTSFAKSNPEIK